MKITLPAREGISVEGVKETPPPKSEKPNGIFASAGFQACRRFRLRVGIGHFEVWMFRGCLGSIDVQG